MLVKHQPLLDRVLIKPIAPGSMIMGDVELPVEAARALNGLPTGTVIAVGPGVRREDGKVYKPDLQAGDIVLYSPAAHTAVQHDGSDHLLMREADIFSVITRATNPAPSGILSA